MQGTHTLVRIEALTEEEIARLSYGVRKALKGGPWHPPAPIKVPPPPDYSTPAKVTARCLERGTGEGADIRAAGKDTEFKKLVRAFRMIAAPVACRVEDTHRSRWRVHGAGDGLTLVPLTDGSGLRLAVRDHALRVLTQRACYWPAQHEGDAAVIKSKAAVRALARRKPQRAA